jgi:RsiW-degrading membrane proteinase PrsW (M82 family)
MYKERVPFLFWLVLSITGVLSYLISWRLALRHIRVAVAILAFFSGISFGLIISALVHIPFLSLSLLLSGLAGGAVSFMSFKKS